MNKSLELSGLDGANPLGFLAAIGTFAILSDFDPQLRLGWHTRARWTPFLFSPSQIEKTKAVEFLASRLCGQRVSEAAEHKLGLPQKRFDAAKKRLKDVKEKLKVLKLKGTQLKIEQDRVVEPVRRRFEKRRRTFLARLKKTVPSPELALGQRPDCAVQEFREHATSIRAESALKARTAADLLAALGAESADLENERIQPTVFCFITGSGHQWFLDTARKLMSQVNEAKLIEALFEPWTYCDEKLSMRWDPVDDRRYAFMDRDPTASDNKSSTVWMANLLAYSSLGLFPCAPTSHGIANACWAMNGRSSAFQWPIWEQPLSRDVVRSLLTQRKFASSDFEGNRDELRKRGISVVFSSQRIQVGNPPLHKINFSPAVAL